MNDLLPDILLHCVSDVMEDFKPQKIVGQQNATITGLQV